MNEHDDPLFKIRFDGEEVGPGRIPLSPLISFLSSMTKALQRTARVLQGGHESVRRGRSPKSIKEETELDLVLLTHGSPAAIAGFDRRKTDMLLPEIDRGLEALEKTIYGLTIVQEDTPKEMLPEGWDTGVLMAWRDAGALFNRGISKVEFTLKGQQTEPITTEFTLSGLERIRRRIAGPQTDIGTIQGRLLMADFKEHGTRCRVHPSTGTPVLCLFGEDQKDQVLDNILQFVHVVGETKTDPLSGEITSITIHDIERLEGHDDEKIDLLPQGTPVLESFWESPTLDELARSQSVHPTMNVRALFGTWPGGEDDGFEAAIDELRHPDSDGNNQQ
jgi:hypothetical protein